MSQLQVDSQAVLYLIPGGAEEAAEAQVVFQSAMAVETLATVPSAQSSELAKLRLKTLAVWANHFCQVQCWLWDTSCVLSHV